MRAVWKDSSYSHWSISSLPLHCLFTGNGSIDFEEFVAMMAKKLKEMDTEHEMKDAFGCVAQMLSLLN